MTDVEKYGLGAVVCVIALLALVVLPLGDDEPVSVEGLARPARPVIISAANDPPSQLSVDTRDPQPRRAPTRKARQGQRVDETPAADFTVRQLTPEGSFDWNESPVAYPGRRSSGDPLPPGESRQTIRHTVAKGETLTDISARYFGTSTRWEAIQDLNPGLDPKRLKVGQVLLVQQAQQAAMAGKASPASTDRGARTAALEPAARAASSADAVRSYVVQKGDTLGGIAQKVLGSSRLVNQLYEANRKVIKSPDQLEVGQRLVIP